MALVPQIDVFSYMNETFKVYPKVLAWHTVGNKSAYSSKKEASKSL
jgi:hypothetical protein